jgi:hypothetical protein
MSATIMTRASIGYVLANTAVMGVMWGYIQSCQQLLGEHFGTGTAFLTELAVGDTKGPGRKRHGFIDRGGVWYTPFSIGGEPHNPSALKEGFGQALVCDVVDPCTVGGVGVDPRTFK